MALGSLPTGRQGWGHRGISRFGSVAAAQTGVYSHMLRSRGNRRRRRLEASISLRLPINVGMMLFLRFLEGATLGKQRQRRNAEKTLLSDWIGRRRPRLTSAANDVTEVNRKEQRRMQEGKSWTRSLPGSGEASSWSHRRMESVSPSPPLSPLLSSLNAGLSVSSVHGGFTSSTTPPVRRNRPVA